MDNLGYYLFDVVLKKKRGECDFRGFINGNVDRGVREPF